MGGKGVGGRPTERERERKRERELEDKRGEHGHVENVRSRYLLNYYEQLRVLDGARKSILFLSNYRKALWGFKTPILVTCPSLIFPWNHSKRRIKIFIDRESELWMNSHNEMVIIDSMKEESLKIIFLMLRLRKKSFSRDRFFLLFICFQETIFNEINNGIARSKFEDLCYFGVQIWSSNYCSEIRTNDLIPSFEFCSALPPFLFFSFPFRILPPRFSLRFLLCLPTSILLFYQNGSHDFRLKLNCQRLSLFLSLSFTILYVTRFTMNLITT